MDSETNSYQLFAASPVLNSLPLDKDVYAPKGMRKMGTLALETNGDVCSNDYVVLGLKDFRIDSIEKPQILSLLSTLLERSVLKNERRLETLQTKDFITIFHGLRAPSLSIQQYIDRIFKYSCCSSSCFVVAYIYMDRFIEQTKSLLTSLNIHRLTITSVMLAAKFMDDAYVRYYFFLSSIDWFK